MAKDDIPSGAIAALVTAQKTKNDDWKQTLGESNSQIRSPSCLGSYTSTEDIPPHQWMQEYHRTRHIRQSPPIKQSLETNGNTGIASNVLEQPRTMHNVNAKLSGLKIDPGINTSHKQGRNSTETAIKRNKTDPLDGYRVYKGPNTVTSGFLHSHERQIVRSDLPLSSGTVQDMSKSSGQCHGRRGHLPSFYFPENLVIPKPIGNDGANLKPSPAQFYTSPFRSHLPPRPRPQSATISTGSQRIGDRTKSNKSRQHTRKGRPPLQVSTKTPSLKFCQSLKITDQHSSPRDGVHPSPRQIGSIPRPSFKLDVNAGLKSESQSSLVPKSILKNTSSVNAKFYLENEFTHDTHDQKTYNTISSDFNLKDFVFSPKTANRTISTSSSHVMSVPIDTITSPKRPMSAFASPTKYELKESQSPRRKSVTFNSYVSLMTGNRVSTIRSLSVDV